jgi:hypothetical protein
MDRIETFKETEVTIYYKLEIYSNKLEYCIKATNIGELNNLPNILESIKNFKHNEVMIIQNNKYLTMHGIFRLLVHSEDPLHIEFLDWICEVFA